MIVFSMIAKESSTITATVLRAPDLRQRAPRSLRVRLGGYALLPRLLDKCRATFAGMQGEYHFACPLDQQFLRFVGLDAESLKEEVAKGGSDHEVLRWIQANASQPREPWEIEAWSAHQEVRAPDSDPDTARFFYGEAAKLSPARTGLKTWADLLDLDDYVSFGGAA